MGCDGVIAAALLSVGIAAAQPSSGEGSATEVTAEAEMVDGITVDATGMDEARQKLEDGTLEETKGNNPPLSEFEEFDGPDPALREALESMD